VTTRIVCKQSHAVTHTNCAITVTYREHFCFYVYYLPGRIYNFGVHTMSRTLFTKKQKTMLQHYKNDEDSRRNNSMYNYKSYENGIIRMEYYYYYLNFIANVQRNKKTNKHVWKKKNKYCKNKSRRRQRLLCQFFGGSRSAKKSKQENRKLII